MARTEIKICGIKDRRTLDAAIGSGASHVGFVHFPKSPRHIGIDRIFELRAHVPSQVKAVVLLVDPDREMLSAFWQSGRPDIIQLHGQEDAALIGQFRGEFPFTYWKAMQVAETRDLWASRGYVGAVERVLFDAKAPVGSALPGGNGVRIDWEILRGYREHSLPWGLAGGLDPSNVAEAVRVTGAPLVDVSSGVESAPGVKNVDKIAAFCKAVDAS